MAVDQWTGLEEVVIELVDTGGTPGVHSAALLLVGISYMDPALSRRTVELFVQRILPKAIEGEYPFDRAILDCIGIATIDLGANWKICDRSRRRRRLRVRNVTPASTERAD